MNYSTDVAKLLRAEAIVSSSAVAELPDDGFVGNQYDTLNPLNLHRFDNLQCVLDTSPVGDFDWSNFVRDPILFQHAEFPGDDITLYPQSPNDDVGLNTNIQQTMELEQFQGALNQSRDAQDPNNGAGADIDSQSPCLDQLYQEMEGSLKKLQDPRFDFSINTDSRSLDFEQPLNMINQFQIPLNELTACGSAAMVSLEEFKILGPVDNGPIYQLQKVAESVAPGPSPAIGIEQPQIIKESFPLVPYPSVYIHADSQPLNSDNKLPPPLIRRGKRTKGSLNRRQTNIESLDPSKYYHRLAEVPHSWGPPDDNGMPTFRYNEHGELSTNDKFSSGQILHYLYEHPLNYDSNNIYDPENSKLTLWIQATPADSGRRYAHKNSDKCRFADCPAPQNSIRNGSFRVAFDEHTASGLKIDPYHCAGFVHLYCLEKFSDFPSVCKDLIVRPDHRTLPEGRNKMALTRDHEEMLGVVRAFMGSSQKMLPFKYEQTLCYQLVSKHLKLEPAVRRTTRNNRGGNHIGLHKGDLEKYVAGETMKLEQKRTASQAQNSSKRKRGTTEEDDCSDFENEAKHQGRTIKRARRRS